jgi:hypothetical protein
MRKSIWVIRMCHCLLACTVLWAGCSKTGPQGATGATGPQGVAGTSGQAGPAGSTIFSGSGAPADTLGLAGDFYIDEQAGALYGPKTISGWGTPVSLKGAQGAPGSTGAPGAAGTNGSTILSGTDTPAIALGTVGDYYFDQVTDSLYGPKTSAGWGTAVSLRGATGAAGAPGTANVIYYNWVGFKDAAWSSFNTLNGYRNYPVLLPALTISMVNTGVVLVYIEHTALLSNGPQEEPSMIQVPTEFFNVENSGKKELLSTMGSPSFLYFELSDALDLSDPGTISFGKAGGYQYRIILIPGGVAGTGIDPHQMSYQQVCTKYGIRP